VLAISELTLMKYSVCRLYFFRPVLNKSRAETILILWALNYTMRFAILITGGYNIHTKSDSIWQIWRWVWRFLVPR